MCLDGIKYRKKNIEVIKIWLVRKVTLKKIIFYDLVCSIIKYFYFIVMATNYFDTNELKS